MIFHLFLQPLEEKLSSLQLAGQALELDLLQEEVVSLVLGSLYLVHLFSSPFHQPASPVSLLIKWIISPSLNVSSSSLVPV